MKLRHIEIYKKQAGMYKNMKEEINGKKVIEHNPGLKVPLTKLMERSYLKH